MWQPRDCGRWGWEGEERYKGAAGGEAVYREKGERKRKNESRIFTKLDPRMYQLYSVTMDLQFTGQ